MAMLISTKDLHELQASTSVYVLDSTWYAPWAGKNANDEFLAKHIPNASRLDIDFSHKITSDSLPHMLPSEETFVSYMNELGITSKSTIILYDTTNKGFASPRGYFTFKYFGHEGNVFLLDGGLSKWISDGYPVESSTDLYKKSTSPSTYKASLKKELVTDLTFIKENIKSKASIVIDARSFERFHAKVNEPWKNVYPDIKGGHIPSSLCIPSDQLYNADGSFKSKDEILDIFEGGGLVDLLDKKDAFVFSCGSGVTACILLVGMEIVGYNGSNLSVYDGSWTEYGTREDTLIEI